jgi:hypothetical protein
MIALNSNRIDRERRFMVCVNLLSAWYTNISLGAALNERMRRGQDVFGEGLLPI